MELIDHKAVIAIRDKAYRAIQIDKGLWKLWHEQHDEYGRECLMTQVIFQQSFDEGYSMGYDDGRQDGALYGGDEG